MVELPPPVGRPRPYAPLSDALAEFAALGPDGAGRRAPREQLVAGYLPVVRHIARRYRNRGEPLDDLEQVGVIGLINALERFEPARGSDFLSFLVPTVTGEVCRHSRDRPARPARWR